MDSLSIKSFCPAYLRSFPKFRPGSAPPLDPFFSQIFLLLRPFHFLYSDPQPATTAVAATCSVKFRHNKNRQKMGNSLTIFFNFVWNFISVVVNWILSSGRGPADATKTRTCATYYYYCKKNGLWLLDCHSRSSDFLVRAREFLQLFPSHSFLRNSWVFLLFLPATFFSPILIENYSQEKRRLSRCIQTKNIKNPKPKKRKQEKCPEWINQ